MAASSALHSARCSWAIARGSPCVTSSAVVPKAQQASSARQAQQGTPSGRAVMAQVASGKEAVQMLSQQKEMPMDEAGIAQLARQVLQSDPEAAASLARYEDALVRVEKAQAAAAELESIFRDAARDASANDAASEKAQERRAQEVLALAEVAAAEKMLQAAEVEVAMAQQQQAKWGSSIDEAAEKQESGKAAAIAAVGGLAASLPLLLLSGPVGVSDGLSLASGLVSCLLFGVTYRYAVRRDAGNAQLKGGVVAAFGLVRAIAAADVLQQAAVTAATAAATASSSSGSSASGAGLDNGGAAAGAALSLDVVGPAALYAGESMLLFGFAALALEVAFQQGVLKRFGEAGSRA